MKKLLQEINIKQWLQIGLMACYIVELTFYTSAVSELDKIASGLSMNNTMLGLIFVTLMRDEKHD